MLPVECVTVCCGYDDFLAETVRHNVNHFNRWVIVTSARPEDEATRELCRKYSLECIVTNEGTQNGEFAKGWLIEKGLRMLSHEGWRLHMDADIVLPARFHHLLEAADIDSDRSKIYGFDRVMCKSWDQWQQLLKTNYLHNHDYHNRLRWPELTIGSRWVDIDSSWVPIGWAQLWHSSEDQWKGVRSRRYPLNHNSACRTDVQHGMQWDRRKRELLPEVIAVHLESEASPLGANWKGRVSKRFGPEQHSTPKPCPVS